MILPDLFSQVKRGGAEGTRTPDPHTASVEIRERAQTNIPLSHKGSRRI